jgi:hypothetical protein
MTEPLYRPADGNGWRCFHCDEVFLTPGAAQDHFGSTPLSLPGCKIKAGEERGLLMALRRAEDEVMQLREATEQLEHEAQHGHYMLQSLKQYFGKDVNCVYDAWCKYETLEGMLLAEKYRQTLAGRMEALRLAVRDLWAAILGTQLGRALARALDKVAA